jgi:periplasmic protein TonB
VSAIAASGAVSFSDWRGNPSKYPSRPNAAIRFALICAAHALVIFAAWNIVVESKPVTLIRASLLAVELPRENIVEPTPNIAVQKTVATPKLTPTQKEVTRTTETSRAPEPAFVPPPEITVVAAPSASSMAQTSPTPPTAPTVSNPPPSAPAEAVVAAPPAKPKIELPSSNADYLTNPAPPYPPLSKRLKEQGRVLLSVFVSVDGSAEKVALKQSSGFERLDQIALETVKRWKFVPGKRDGSAEAMWVTVPIVFELTA